MAYDVLILGGGFAGLAALDQLSRYKRAGADINVRLIDQFSHSVFRPLLPDIISGFAQPEHLRHSLTEHCAKNDADFVQAEIHEINIDKKCVNTAAGNFSADYMLLAVGAEPTYFGQDHLRQVTTPLNEIRDGLEIGRRTLSAIEQPDPDSIPHILIVGGGYTGFETAAALVELIHKQTKKPYPNLAEILDLQILELKDIVLPHSSAKVRDWVIDLLKKYGISVRTNITVKDVHNETAKLSDGSQLHNSVVIWTPGVEPSRVVNTVNSPSLKNKRLVVDEYLRLPKNKAVFAAGDVAGAKKPGTDNPCYMSIQFSLRGGKCAAVNIMHTITGKKLKIFDPVDVGYVVPMAPGEAAGRVFQHELRGRLPYWLHYFMSAYRSWDWQNRRAIVKDFFTEGHVSRKND